MRKRTDAKYISLNCNYQGLCRQFEITMQAFEKETNRNIRDTLLKSANDFFERSDSARTLMQDYLK